MGMGPRVLCLDFDGVLHAYTSGWHGPRKIPDSAIPGALEFVANAFEFFEVHILSSRSHYLGGRRAMKRWLVQQLVELAPVPDAAPAWWLHLICQAPFTSSWTAQVRCAAKRFVQKIKFPKHKPPATVTIDDRALTFQGVWPSLKDLLDFRPWRMSKDACLELTRGSFVRACGEKQIGLPSWEDERSELYQAVCHYLRHEKPSARRWVGSSSRLEDAVLWFVYPSNLRALTLSNRAILEVVARGHRECHKHHDCCKGQNAKAPA